jgi:hypothetical protein
MVSRHVERMPHVPRPSGSLTQPDDVIVELAMDTTMPFFGLCHLGDYSLISDSIWTFVKLGNIPIENGVGA